MTSIADRLTKEQIEEFREAFQIFDKDGDGTISTSELRKVMKNLGQTPSYSELKELIKEVDTDGNGEVDFDEFCTLMVKQLNIGEDLDDCEEAFKLFDNDEKGLINADDLREVLQNLPEQLSASEISNLLTEADPDKDGQINFSDFLSTFAFK